MRSPDSQTTPENILEQFEKSLIASIKHLKERKEDLSRQDLKTFVRAYCKRNAHKLGLGEKKAVEISQYFFRLIYEDPERATKMWELLYALSENSTNKEIAEQVFSELLVLNRDGVTLLWRLVRGIVNGDFEVKKTNINDEPTYHITTPSDSSSRKLDKIRQYTIASLKELVSKDITNKPIPDAGEASTKMTRAERKLFFKIFTFMQSDIDALINSDAWKPATAAYFEGITKHLVSTVENLNVAKAKSDARKKRYRDFISHVLQTYLKQLLDYCKIMLSKNGESNPFAADLLFEHYLISNNLFVESVKEPSVRIIQKKWESLAEKMKNYAEEDATMYGLPTQPPQIMAANLFGEPANFGPQVTDEVSREDISKVRAITAEEARHVTDKTLRMGTVSADDDWDEVWEKPSAQANPYAKTAVNLAIKDELSRSADILDPQYIVAIPGTKAERLLIEKIKQDIDDIFSKYKEDIKSGISDTFVEKLTAIAKEKVTTYSMMLDFISRLVAYNEDLRRNLSSYESSNIFDNIVSVFNQLGSSLCIPNEMLRELEEKNDEAHIPNLSDLESLARDIPSIDSEEFGYLKAFLLRKGLYQEFQRIESETKETTIGDDLMQLRSFKDLNTRLRLAFSPSEGFLDYYKQRKLTTENALKTIKKLRGNWFTKYFKFGRSRQVKNEMKTYLDQLESGVKKAWYDSLRLALNQYGRIIFGSSLYIQKEW